MPISVQKVAGTRTLLECVNRILTGAGETEVSTVDNAVDTTLKAVHAVNDATLDIFNRSQWYFRKEWMALDLVAGQMWYALPDDFGEMCYDFPVYLGTSNLTYIDLTELIAKVPSMRYFPTDAGVSLSVVVQSSTLESGESRRYTLSNEYIGFYPVPSEEFVDTQGQAVGAYYRQPGELLYDQDELDLPVELWTAHYYLSLAFLKQHIESMDFQADESRAERLIARAMARRTQRGLHTPRFVPTTQKP